MMSLLLDILPGVGLGLGVSALGCILEAFVSTCSLCRFVSFAACSEFHKATYSSLFSEFTAFFHLVDDI